MVSSVRPYPYCDPYAFDIKLGGFVFEISRPPMNVCIAQLLSVLDFHIICS